MKICAVSGCGHIVDAKGLCSAHYKRMQKFGTPLGGKPMRAREGEPLAFIKLAFSYEGAGCLLWPYARNSAGYGHLIFNGKDSLAHRIVCEVANGAPSDSRMEAAHSCGNGHMGCINKNHLRWATRADNFSDMVIHGTRLRGEKCNSKVTEEDVRKIRSLSTRHTQSELARMFGVEQTNISAIIRRKTWRHVL